MSAADLNYAGLERLGKEVAVSDIDRELHAFFASDQGISRASLLNLAIYSEDAGSIEKNTAAIQEMTEQTACRAILIISLPGPKRSVHAWIEAHCNLTNAGEKAVCSEQVSFVLEGSSANLVRNIVFAHIDADLPVVLWWQGELSDIFEERLFSRIDRLIFDSRDWKEPAAQFLRIAVAQAEEADQVGFIPHDLSFTRTNPIRAAIANCFDDPRARARISDFDEVEIESSRGHRISGLWLGAWFAARLGYSLVKRESGKDGYVFQKSKDGKGTFTITIREEESGTEGDSQAIGRVRMGAPSGHISIWRSEDLLFWVVASELADAPHFEKLIPVAQLGDAELVGEVLRRSGQNRIMCSAMERLREMLTV